MSLRASGQVACEARSTIDILTLTVQAWREVSPITFQSAWIATGLVTQDEIRYLNNLLGAVPGRTARPEPPTVENAQTQLSTFFSKYSKSFTPQLCTQLEWQIQDRAVLHSFGMCLFILCFCTASMLACKWSHILGTVW